MELNKEQIIKLIEENLQNKFMYHLDEMENEKRPFGNSGSSEIIKDIMEITGIKKSWNVTDEDELSDLMYKFMEDCFKEVHIWIEENRDKFKIKLIEEVGE